MNLFRTLSLRGFSMGLLAVALLAVAFAGATSSAAAPYAQATGTVMASTTAMTTGTAMASTTAMATGTSMMGTPMATGTSMMGTPMATGTSMMGTPMATGTSMMGTPMATGTAMMGTPMASRTAMASGTPSAVATTGFTVAPRFQSYYDSQEGLRLLGYAVSDEVTVKNTAVMTASASTIPAQYFQKARLEDQTANGYTAEWRYTYGLLVPDLVAKGSNNSVSNTSVTWAMLKEVVGTNKVGPPAGFQGGAYEYPDGRRTFIPFSSSLSSADGYDVPDMFWDYMNSGVFPAGWLHDLGLPLSASMPATVVRDGQTRNITLQAFERGILTYDDKNPADFFVERANIGFDYLTEFGANGAMPGASTTPMATTTAMMGTPMATTTARASTTAAPSITAGTTTTAVATTTAMASTTSAPSITAGTTTTAVASTTSAPSITAGTTRTVVATTTVIVTVVAAP